MLSLLADAWQVFSRADGLLFCKKARWLAGLTCCPQLSFGPRVPEPTFFFLPRAPRSVSTTTGRKKLQERQTKTG